MVMKNPNNVQKFSGVGNEMMTQVLSQTDVQGAATKSSECNKLQDSREHPDPG